MNTTSMLLTLEGGIPTWRKESTCCSVHSENVWMRILTAIL